LAKSVKKPTIASEYSNCVCAKVALLALEIQPARLAFASGNEDHAAIVNQPLVNRQRVGRRDAGALAVGHRARYTDEHDAIDPGADQSTEPLTQRRLVHESRDLTAQSAHSWQLGLDRRPEVQHVELGLHLDRPVVVFFDQPGHHHVPDPAVDPGFRRQLHHFAGVFESFLGTAFEVRRHQLKRDGVQSQRAAPHSTTSPPPQQATRHRASRQHSDARSPLLRADPRRAKPAAHRRAE